MSIAPGKKAPAETRRSFLDHFRKPRYPRSLRPVAASADAPRTSPEATDFGIMYAQTGTVGSGPEPATDVSLYTYAFLADQATPPVDGAIIMSGHEPLVRSNGVFPIVPTDPADPYATANAQGDGKETANSPAGGNTTVAPQPVRSGTVADPLLRRTTKLPLAGTFGQQVGPGNPFAEGGIVEQATRQPIGLDQGDSPVDERMGGGVKDVNPVLNDGWLDQPPTDNLGHDLQPANGFMANASRVLHAAQGFVPLLQLASVNRAVVLVGNAAQDCPIPRGAVAFRIEWTGRASGANDLWVGRVGAAEIPTQALINAAGGVDEYIASILNPLPSALYFCKNVTNLSLLCANNCIVSLQFYLQA